MIPFGTNFLVDIGDHVGMQMWTHPRELLMPGQRCCPVPASQVLLRLRYYRYRLATHSPIKCQLNVIKYCGMTEESREAYQ